VTRLVDGAVEAAPAYRLPDPDEGRKVVVHVSEPGRGKLRRLEAMVQAHEAALGRSLGAGRVAALVEALRGVSDPRA
jgi:DNA-binding MarR family transcriptional regulator